MEKRYNLADGWMGGSSCLSMIRRAMAGGDVVENMVRSHDGVITCTDEWQSVDVGMKGVWGWDV